VTVTPNGSSADLDVVVDGELGLAPEGELVADGVMTPCDADQRR